MTQISIPTGLGLGLESLTAPTVVCDEQGRVIGQFIPTLLERPIIKPEDNCPYTPEELEQHFINAITHPEHARPLADFWKEMGRTS